MIVKKETCYCDRCGIELSSPGTDGRLFDSPKLTKVGTFRRYCKHLCLPFWEKAHNTVYIVAFDSGRQLDLCPNCKESLQQWWNQPDQEGE